LESGSEEKAIVEEASGASTGAGSAAGSAAAASKVASDDALTTTMALKALEGSGVASVAASGVNTGVASGAGLEANMGVDSEATGAGLKDDKFCGVDDYRHVRLVWNQVPI
jgi:hypothetical protein